MNHQQKLVPPTQMCQPWRPLHDAPRRRHHNGMFALAAVGLTGLPSRSGHVHTQVAPPPDRGQKEGATVTTPTVPNPFP